MAQWSSAPREQRRQLVHALLVEAGATYATIDVRAAYDDLIFTAVLPLGRRRMRIRVMHRRVVAGDMVDLAQRAARQELADYQLVGCEAEDDDAVASDDHYLAPEEVIEQLEASAAVEWRAGEPLADRESFITVQASALELELADTLGLRALAPLSRNKLPWAMRVAGIPGAPDDWFEKVFFRTATAGLGLLGRRFGSAQRAQRVADGLLRTSGGRDAILYDCKAARDGYTMTADHERRLIEYARQPTEHGGVSVNVKTVVIVSSTFPGEEPRHPFHARREAFRRAGVDLAYVRASDVVAAALAIRPALDLDTSSAAVVDWCGALGEGIVTRATLLEAVAPGGSA